MTERQTPMTTTVVVGEELHAIVHELIEDSTAVVGPADETGMIPAAWCSRAGPGSGRIRQAVRDRLTHLVDGDRGFLGEGDDTPVVVTVRVGSNTTLPPILTRYLPTDQR